MLIKWCFVSLIFLLPLKMVAQAIDNTTSFRNISSEHYVRLIYENDFFTASDRDYTQGISLEIVSPGLRKFFLSKILWYPRSKPVSFGLSLETDTYTPNLIDKTEIQYGDRPYASDIMLKSFVIATDNIKGTSFSSQLSIGVIGPWAGGKEMQTAIHNWIAYKKPLGWHNQIKNDVVLNYQLNFEKRIAELTNNFLLNGFGTARAGTLNTKAGVGMNLMAGAFHSPFSLADISQRKKIKLYFYNQAAVNVVGYDATLQGGLFNRSSVYTIPSVQLDRLVFQNRYGIVLSWRRLWVEYFKSFQTLEYDSGVEHKTGGLQLGFIL